MDIKVIASGSAGNCYLITDSLGNKLLLECGITFSRLLKSVGFDLKSIQGCLVTHEHKDHSKAILDLLKYGVQVYCSEGTARACGVLGHHNLVICEHKQPITVANRLEVWPLNAEHDAAEPLMFVLQNYGTGEKLLFATDTYYIRYKFPAGLTHVMIECNYDMDILNENIHEGLVDMGRRSRILRSHMNIDTCREFFKANAPFFKGLRKILLIHLSNDNSNVADFIADIEKITGVPVDVI